MDIIDLSHVISADMPVYPGAERPVLTAACTIEEAGFLEKKIAIYSHVGTHMDAPAHVIAGAKTLDQFSVDQFFGPACVIPVHECKKGTVEREAIQPYEALIADSAFVLFRTGWERFWGTDQYYSGFPVLSIDAATWLCRFPLKGIGVDAISVDRSGSKGLPVHHVFLGGGLVIVENLVGLDAMEEDRFWFSCLPIRLKDADGSPGRAVAIHDMRSVGEGGQ